MSIRKSDNKIAQAIYEYLKAKSGKDLTNSSKKVVEYLVRKRLMSRSSRIMRALEAIENKDKNIVKAEIIASEVFTDGLRLRIGKALKTKYKADKILVDEKLDKSLIGGFKIKVGDEVIDASLAGRLNKLSSHLTQTL